MVRSEWRPEGSEGEASGEGRPELSSVRTPSAAGGQSERRWQEVTPHDPRAIGKAIGAPQPLLLHLENGIIMNSRGGGWREASVGEK